MKPFNLKNILLLLSLSVIFNACQKDYIAPNYTVFANPVEKPFLAEPKLQEFIFNTNDLPYTITTENGTSILIPANAFTVSGEPANGQVTLTIREFSKKGEMIAAGINTMNFAKMLESYGSLYIAATIDGVPADNQLSGESGLEISKPASGATFTMLFEGGVMPVFATDAPQFNWVVANEKVEAKNDYFVFNWGKLGWINCDIFYSGDQPKTTLYVNLPENPGQAAGYKDDGNTYVFFVPKRINSAVQIYSHTNNEQVHSYPNSMPVGMQGVLVGYCIKDGHYWYAKEEIVITDNMEVTLKLSSSDQTTIQKQIAALNDY